MLPEAGVRVRVIDCTPNCPDPVLSDPAGNFRFAELASPAWLRFEPPGCAVNDFECEPLQPREVERQSGARTALGRKWPDLAVDLMQRFMPSVADVLYVKREGTIPNMPNAAGAAGWDLVWINGANGWSFESELSTFLHELIHAFETRLRFACRPSRPDVDGLVLQETWMQAYQADRERLQRLGLPLLEPDTSLFQESRVGPETLAYFTEMYLVPDHITMEKRYRFPSPLFMTHAELEHYAPNRIDWFERMLYGRSVDRRSFFQANPHAETWPGMCASPERLTWALDRLPPLPQISKSESGETKPLEGFKCGFLDLPLW